MASDLSMILAKIDDKSLIFYRSVCRVFCHIFLSRPRVMDARHFDDISIFFDILPRY